SPTPSTLSMARSYSFSTPTSFASTSLPSFSLQVIFFLPFNSSHLVRTQPSAPTTVPRTASLPSAYTRTVDWLDGATTGRKRSVQLGLVRESSVLKGRDWAAAAPVQATNSRQTSRRWRYFMGGKSRKLFGGKKPGRAGG